MIEHYGLKPEVLCVSKLGWARIIPCGKQKKSGRDGENLVETLDRLPADAGVVTDFTWEDYNFGRWKYRF
jgi:hypothetical protein